MFLTIIIVIILLHEALLSATHVFVAGSKMLLPGHFF